MGKKISSAGLASEVKIVMELRMGYWASLDRSVWVWLLEYRRLVFFNGQDPGIIIMYE